MKKIIQKILPVFITSLMGASLISGTILTTPVYAEGEGCTCAGGASGHMTEGAILSYCECGGGESVKAVFLLVVDVFSVIVGIVGVIGVVIVGIQYLTAGGNEEQTRKAKRRLFEIVIGIMAYVLIRVVLYWLLPGFDESIKDPRSSSAITTTIASFLPFIGA